MRISAKADYAVRAAMGLALVGGPAKAEHIAQRHAIPLKFLEKILFDLRHAGLVATRRGPEGGYWLRARRRRRSPSPTSCAPSTARWPTCTASRPRTSSTRRASPRSRRSGSPCARTCAASSESVTIADLAGGTLPPAIEELTAGPDSWARR